MATTKQVTFEGTNGAAVTTAATGLDSIVGSWTYDTSQHAAGASSAKASPAAFNPVFVRNHGSTTIRYYDFCCRLSTLDSGDLLLADLRLGSAMKAQLYIQAGSKLALRNGTNAVDTTVANFPTTQWVRVQWGVNGSTQQARLWFSSTLADLFNNAQSETLTGAYTGGAFDRIRFGCDTAHTLDVWVDRYIEDDATWPVSGASGNQIPVAVWGADQSVVSGSTVTTTLAASTDADGTIASYAVTQNTGPTVSITQAGAVFSFLAPTVSVNTDIILGGRVTDDQGAQSPEATTTITITPSTGTPGDDFFELFEDGTTGATVTAAPTGNTAFDSVDSGITFSGTGIGDGSHSASITSAAIAVMTHILPAATSLVYTDEVYSLPALPASGQFFYLEQFRSGATPRGDMRVNSDGTITCRGTSSATTACLTSVSAVTAGVPFRVGHKIINGGNQEIKLYFGSNLWGTTADETKTATTATTTGTFDRVRWGFTTAPSASATQVIDSIRLNSTGYPLPLGGGGGGGGPTEDFVALFELGTPGNTATTALTGFDSITAGALFTSDAIGDGSVAVTQTMSASTGNMTHQFAAATTYYTDWVYRTTAYGGGSAIIAGYLSGASTFRAKIKLNSDGTVAIQNVSTTVDTSALVIPLNGIVRFAWGLTGATQTLNIFTGGNLWGATPNEVLTGAAPNTSADRVRLGLLTADTMTWTIDSVRADDTVWPAPLTGGTVRAGSNLYVPHNGVLEQRLILVAHGGILTP